MSRMEERDGTYRYSVAWLDTLAQGAALGRGVLTSGEHAQPADIAGGPWGRDPLRYASRSVYGAPRGVPGGLLRPSTVGAFNELWFRRAAINHIGPESIARFFHPLDAVRNWNRIYGPQGFLQYQYVVPFAAHEVVTESVRRLSAARSPAFLAVLKRFGNAADAPLSFPMPGWTLALDLPAALPGLNALLRGLDELVVQAGGRVYLSKDSRLAPDMLRAMYPRLEEWRALVEELDPHSRMASDLARRVGLQNPAA
jgi:decaprenylphospho-beta-D-ribofuranose 2-oxidase